MDAPNLVDETTASGGRVPRDLFVFLVLAIGLAWVVATPLWIRGLAVRDPLLPVFGVIMMITPAASTVLVLLLRQRRGRGEPVPLVLRRLGVWPLRPLRRTIGVSVAAIVAPPVLVGITLLLLAVLGLQRFDLTGFSGYAEVVRTLAPAGTTLPPVRTLVIAQLAALPLAWVINAPFALGEELGWRGFLLPGLLPLGPVPALVLSGAIWGLWHAPLILLGYNFGRTDVVGVLLMIGACVLLGTLIGWTRLRTGSIWPAVLGHASLNGAAGLGTLLASADGPRASLTVGGGLGLIMWIVLAVVIIVLVLTGQFRSDRLRGRLEQRRATV